METRELESGRCYGDFGPLTYIDADGLNVKEGNEITAIYIEGYDPYILVNADIMDVAEAISDMDEVTKEWIDEWFDYYLEDMMKEGGYCPVWDVYVDTYEVVGVEDNCAFLVDKDMFRSYTLDQTKYFEKKMTYVKKVEE